MRATTTGDGMAKGIVLASQSRSRRQMLEAAGLAFEVMPSSVDEVALRGQLEATGQLMTPTQMARALAEAKAIAVSRAHPDAMVIGGDQVLALGRRLFEKPADVGAARRQLMELRGRMHDLVSAAVLAKNGQVVWGHAETATLRNRHSLRSSLADDA